MMAMMMTTMMMIMMMIMIIMAMVIVMMRIMVMVMTSPLNLRVHATFQVGLSCGLAVFVSSSKLRDKGEGHIMAGGETGENTRFTFIL